MRPVVKGRVPLDGNGNPKIYTNHRQAKRDLISRIGRYCSYCERKISANMAIEHVQPQSLNPLLSLVWNNFLLSCVNCNSTKGDTPIVMNNYYWPDIHNTLRAFDYSALGFIYVSLFSGISGPIAINTIALTGLNDIDISDEASDTRWEERLEAWFIAEEELDDYLISTRDAGVIQGIVRVATGHGFWSIWMKVFEQHSAVQNALIIGFSGTFTLCLTTDINRL